MINPFRVLRRKDKGEDVPQDNRPVVLADVPWWVKVFTDWGRPLAAVVVLVLCAPGEQHLAHLAGWSNPGWLSWGMAGLFSMYAGIAAVVATVRPKGSPGKRSAVWGAVVSLLLAMGAQPVSHLFVTGWLSAEPRAPWVLVAVVSCVPPFILGHLLHLAASPVSPRTSPARTEDKDTVQVGEDRHGRPVTASLKDKRRGRRRDKDIPTGTGKGTRTRWLFEDRTYRAGVPEDTDVPVSSGDKDAVTGSVPAPEDTAVPVPAGDRDNGTRPEWLYDEDGIRPGHREDTGDAMHYSPPPAGDDLSSRRKLTDVIKDVRAAVGDDPEAIKDAVLATPGYGDMRSTPQKRNTLNTAVRRALAKKTA